jgi:hypothetical protein
MWINSIIYFWLYSERIGVLYGMSKKEVFISHAAWDHIAVTDIQSWLEYSEKKLKYQEKVGFYQRVLSRASSKLRACNVFGMPGGINTPGGPLSSLYYQLVDWNRLSEKCMLLEQIISVGEQIAYDYDEGSELFFKKLEKELSGYLDIYDEFLESHYWAVATSPVYAVSASLISEIKTLKVRLRLLLKKIYHRSYFDMRRHIRSMVRFLFIKSDDDADVSNAVVSADSISLHNILNPSSWKKRKYSSV